MASTITSSRHQHHSTKSVEKWKQSRKLSSSVTSAESSVGSSSRSRHRSSNSNNYERHRPPKIVTSSAVAVAGAGGSPKRISAAAAAAAAAASPQQRPRTANNNNNNTNNSAVLHACDDKGRCIFHPHVQLRKKAVMGVIGGWKDIRHTCPDCERKEVMQKLMAREASEIQQMERILYQMEQLDVTSSTVNDGDDTKNIGLRVSVSSRCSQDSKERNSSQAARRRQSQQLERRSRNQSKQSSSPKKAAAQRRSRRQRTLSPKKDRNDVIRELRRQRTLSPKDRKSVKELRRQRTLSPKDRKNVRELRRQRTLSPKDRKNFRELRRQSTLSPKKDRNGNRELRRQRTLSPREDRPSPSNRELRRQRTLSPIKGRDDKRQSRRQRTLSPKPKQDRTKLLRRQTTLSPIKDRHSNTKELRRQGTFSPKKAPSSSPPSSTKREENDYSDEDSSSSSFQRQQLRKWAMWKRMALEIEMEAIDANDDENESTTSSRNGGTGDDSSNEAGNASTTRAEKVEMEAIGANDDDNVRTSRRCSDVSGDSSNKAGNASTTRAEKVEMKAIGANDDDNVRTSRRSSDVSGDSSYSRTTTSSSVRHDKTCPLHPTVRMRNSRFSLCCALEKTVELRKAKQDAGCGMAVVKSDADDASSVGDENNADDDDDAAANEDDVSLSDEDSSNDVSIDIEEFSDDDSSVSKQSMDEVNEETSTADTTPVSFNEGSTDFNEGSTDLTAAKWSTAGADECGGEFEKNKANTKSSTLTVEAWTEVEDVYSDSDEEDDDDDGPFTTAVQQGSQSGVSGTAKHDEGEGNYDRLEIDDATGAIPVSISGRREIENDKSATIKSFGQAQSSAVERQSTTSLPSETVTNASDMSEARTLDSTPASHENSNDARPGEESNAISTPSAESEAYTSNQVQQLDGAKRKPSSNQRLSRSTVRRDVINKRRSHSKSLDGESNIPFFAALVENARSRSQSVTRNLGGQRRKKLWARSRSRTRSVRQDDGSAHTIKKEETMVSNLSTSKSFSLSRSFRKKGGKDTGNKMSNTASTNGEKDANENRSRRRKGKAGEKSSSGTESALKKTMISSPEKSTEFLHLTANHREPITHPRYELGDVAKEEDMITFPATSPISSRRGRRRRVQDSSQSTSSADEEQDRLNESKFIASVKELHHLDAAFIRRSNGRWTYAIVANTDDKGIVFVVDKKGSTKTLPSDTRKWKDSVRRIKVLAHGRVSE